ncbi:hypothetical protein SNEBB_005910 [Seison nebaliae]|nr:hypothetical protein SNEBB_005910 [Seison nebaliae]
MRRKKQNILKENDRIQKKILPKKENPFDQKIMKVKKNILNQNKGKYLTGKRIVNRLDQQDKRKKLLLNDMKKETKQNQLIDKRYAEKNQKMNLEEKMLGRLKVERMRQIEEEEKKMENLEKKNDFNFLKNLNDQNDDIDDGINLNEEEDERESLFMRNNFFVSTDDGDDGEEKRQSREEWLQEMMMESKKEKLDKKKEAEKIAETIKDLNEKWKEITTIPNVVIPRKMNMDGIDNPDDYDKNYVLLGVDPSTHSGTSKSLNDNELALEKFHELNRLENERMLKNKRRKEPKSLEDLSSDYDKYVDVKKKISKKDLKKMRYESDIVNCQYEELEENDEEVIDETNLIDEEEILKRRNLKNSEEDDQLYEGNLKETLKESKLLPFVIHLPRTENQLNILLKMFPNEHSVIYDRLINSNHPRLSEKNKDELKIFMSDVFFPFFFNCSKYLETKKSINCAYLMLFRLSRMFPETSSKLFIHQFRQLHYEIFGRSKTNSGNIQSTHLLRMIVPIEQSTNVTNEYQQDVTIRSLINEEFELNTELINKKIIKNSKNIFLIFRTVTTVFPIMARRHLIVYPFILFYISLMEILDQFVEKNDDSLIVAIKFIHLFIHHYLSSTKWYVPELITLTLASLRKMDDDRLKTHYFHFNVLMKDLLRLNEIYLNIGNASQEITWASTGTSWKPAMLNVLHPHYKTIQSIIQLLSTEDNLTKEKYSDLKENCEKWLKFYDVQQKEICRTKLKLKTKSLYEQKSLILFEPKLDRKKNRFDGQKRLTKEEEMKEKLENMKNLKNSLKKEKKSAARELRRDMQVVAGEKMKAMMESDAKRKRKLKEIHGQLATQEGDFRRIKRRAK